MILFQINPQCPSVVPFEGDAPRAVDVDRIALRLPLQRMKVETGLPQVIELFGRFEGIQPADRAAVQIGPNPGRFAGFEQLFQTAMPEALDHRKSVMRRLTVVKHRLTTFPRLAGMPRGLKRRRPPPSLTGASPRPPTCGISAGPAALVRATARPRSWRGPVYTAIERAFEPALLFLALSQPAKRSANHSTTTRKTHTTATPLDDMSAFPNSRTMTKINAFIVGIQPDCCKDCVDGRHGS
jgi:hypothetical protein